METSTGTAVQTSADVVRALVHDFLEMLGDGEADRLILRDVNWLLSMINTVFTTTFGLLQVQMKRLRDLLCPSLSYMSTCHEHSIASDGPCSWDRGVSENS